jgi:ABC-type Zn uptake system ZnuABC Zn-binding protein ZnuA
MKDNFEKLFESFKMTKHESIQLTGGKPMPTCDGHLETAGDPNTWVDTGNACDMDPETCGDDIAAFTGSAS